MKVNFKYITLIIIIYPIINIISCWFFDGENKVSSFICIFIMALFFLPNMTIKRNSIIAIMILVLTITISITRDKRFNSIATTGLFVLLVLLMMSIDNERIRTIDIAYWLYHERILFYFSQTVYLISLLCYVLKNGLYNGWGTRVLNGPYHVPHTLAYILLFMCCGNIYLAVVRSKMIAGVIAAIEIVLILLTAVRSVLLSISIIAMFVFAYYFKIKEHRKILGYGIAVIFASIFGIRYGVFNAFYQKTMQAVKGGFGLSNSRPLIFKTSLETLRQSTIFPFNSLFGEGWERMIAHNYLNNLGAIHAHNDFIDILVSYGLICLIVYNYYYLSMCKKNGGVWLFLFMFVLCFANGLYVYIDSIPLLFLPIILFASTDNKTMYKKIKYGYYSRNYRIQS